MLVILAGLPGCGKSTLAGAVAPRLGAAVLDKDPIRASLFGPAGIEYTAEQDDFVMELMLQAARYLLAKRPGRFVFLDGRTFSQAYQRRRVIDFADGLGEPWRIIECVCPETIARERLAHDLQSGQHPAANRTIELYEQVRAHFDPIIEPHLVIDTGDSIEDCAARVAAWLAGPISA